MARHFSKRLVIDASVLKAAGESEHPVSSACRNTLEVIRNVCHRVVYSDPLRREWRSHKSRFSTGWLAAMTNSGKVVSVNDDDVEKSLRLVLDILPCDDEEAVQARKDAHLLASALAADKIVISLDESAREIYRQLAVNHRQIGKVIWVNPIDPGDRALEWLREGAAPKGSLRLSRPSDRKQGSIQAGR